MQLFLVCSIGVFAIALMLIIRELSGRAPRCATIAAGHAPLDMAEDELELTRVGRNPSVTNVPILSAVDPCELEPTSATGQAPVTLYESGVDEAIDEPTGLHERILVHGLGRTDRGLRRLKNEDSFLVAPKHDLYLIADGMGGCAGGEVASKLAVDVIRAAFDEKRFEGDVNPKRSMRGNELVWGVEAANRTILDYAAKRPEYAGMGTTLVAARFSPRKQLVYIAYVGDSRCYRLRDGKLTLLTTDHTLARFGVTGPFGAHLSRALGARRRVKVDMVIDAPLVGDTYLLCSDGLSKMVADQDIRRVMMLAPDLQDAAQGLVAKANAQGGKDNVTVILVGVQPREAAMAESYLPTSKGFRA